VYGGYVWSGSAWLFRGDTGWVALPPASGFSGGSPALQYRVLNGVVYLRGQLTKSSGNIAQGDVLCALPTAIQTPNKVFVCGSSTAGGLMEVTYGGSANNISVRSSPTVGATYVFLDPISFAV
jgi:hypothetical protein